MTASATAIAALAARLGLASLVDGLDQRALSAAVLVLAAMVFCALALFPFQWVLIVGSVIWGVTMSNVTILSAIIVRREFGARSFGAVFGFASTIIQLATALGPSFYGVLREASSSYQLPLLIAAALDVAAAVIVWSGRASLSAAKEPAHIAK
jgi:cyanate permease